MKEIIFPKKLKKGDKFAIISPAGSVEPAQLEKTLQLIDNKGFKSILGKHLYAKFSNGYSYAGTEKERAEDLNWALNDPEIKAVWASRGGYGCQQLLQHLHLKDFKKQPKWFIGYSDNTVLQAWLLKNNVISIHGQSIKTSSFSVSEQSFEGIFNILEGKKLSYDLSENNLNRRGTAEGHLVGGNLALIYALLGTKYSFDFKDNILFIEDIGEQYYSLDRMLMSLELAGVFGRISGLIVGGMTNMGDEKLNKNFEESFDEMAYQIISERISKYDFPVIFGFPNGHIFENHPLIIGSHIKIKVGNKSEIKFINN